MLPILFQDSRFVVLDKPAGLPVHPGRGGGPSVEDWFPLLSRRRDGPWLAHRLDADTSGCLVVALRRAALHAAQEAFASGQAGKVYWAVVQGRPHADRGVVDAPLSKRNERTGWWMAIDPAGASAKTEWRILHAATPRPDPGFTCLELRPHTGRTHQIRVHCAHLGCPILGDPIYGDGKGRLQLLARSIMLPLSPALCATAPPPAHMIAALAACGL